MIRYYRKVIRIRAEDSPNVREGRQVVPGVLSADEYKKRRATWDAVRQTIGLDAEFYEGAEILMFPPAWLGRAEQLAAQLRGKPRKAIALGCDPAEGGDKSAWSVVDEYGLIFLLSMKTPDTSVVPARTLALMREYGIPPERVAFDRGGGGKQHADALREQGYPVRTVAFGESLALDPKRGLVRIEEKIEHREEKYVYVNRRSQMYGELRQRLDPAADGPGFAIPAEYTAIRQQLSPIPLLYDKEGRMRLPAKNRTSKDSKEKTLVELIGHSPDESDSLVLALHAMTYRAQRATAGAV